MNLFVMLMLSYSHTRVRQSGSEYVRCLPTEKLTWPRGYKT